MKRYFILVGIFFLWVSQAQAQDPVYNIENVTGDLYRFQSNAHYGVFLVTDEGIILADPINTETATWLKGELDKRFGVPVKYVIYSHDHADHISGGEVFAETATYLSHVYAKPKIEEGGYTVVPDKRFPKGYRITLGGKIVDLFYFGGSHSDNLITVYFPAERAVFLVDLVGVERLPYQDFKDWYFPGAITYLQKVEQLDFDYLLPGHGKTGTKKDLTDHKLYLLELYDQVARAYLAGLGLEETKDKVNLEHYFHWDRYQEMIGPNIEGMYRIISELKPVKIPKIDRYVRPAFPPNAEQARFVGWVLLKFDVNSKGQVENILVFDADAESLKPGITQGDRGVRAFSKAAIRALEKTKYEPGIPFKGLYRWESFALPLQQGDFDPFGILGPGGNFETYLTDPNAHQYLRFGPGGRALIGIEQ